MKKNSIEEEDLVGDPQDLVLVAFTVDSATSHYTNKLSKEDIQFFKRLKLLPIIIKSMPFITW
jgi:hypothetical protein